MLCRHFHSSWLDQRLLFAYFLDPRKVLIKSVIYLMSMKCA